MNAKEKAQELVDNFLATEKEYKEYADYIHIVLASATLLL